MANYGQIGAQAADAVIGPQQTALQLQQAQARAAQQAALASLTQWGQTGGAAITGSYDQGIGSLQQNRTDAAGQWNGMMDRVAGNFNTGLQQGQQAQAASRDYLSKLAQSTGGSFGGAMAEASAPGEAMFNTIQELARNQGQQTLAGLGAWGQGHNTMYQRAEDNMRGARSQDITRFQADVGNRLSEANLKGIEQEGDFIAQLLGLTGERNKFALQFGQAAADRDSDASYKQAQLDESRASRDQEMAFKSAQAAQAQANWERSFAQENNREPTAWEREQFDREMALKNRSLDLQYAPEPQDEEIMNYGGRQGAQLYAQDRKLHPATVDSATQVMAWMQNSGIDPVSAVNQDPRRVLEQYGHAHRTKEGTPRAPQINPVVFRDLVAILGGGY